MNSYVYTRTLNIIFYAHELLVENQIIRHLFVLV
jgi:hypothetical protein